MKLSEHIRAEEGVKGIVLSLAEVCIEVSEGFIHHSKAGLAGTTNATGDEQMKMDLWANGQIIKKLKATGLVRTIATEEEEDAISCGAGDYSVVLDPLDGSGNIAYNLPVGTIFGIFRGESVLQRGRDLLAAGYVLYGPLTIMVLATEKGVDEYVLDSGEFVLRAEGVTIPDGKFYTPGAKPNKWLPEYRAFLSAMEAGGNKIRNFASMVADFHGVVSRGGIYTYPGMEGNPNGKIRLVFECNPLSFIAEKAGGLGTDGRKSILDIEPRELHQRTPVFIGSMNLMRQVKKAYGG